jgi:hypothetical protein
MTLMIEKMTESNFTLRPGMHFHLVGIGGAGISAIARVLLGRGFVVSGSDRQGNALTADLQSEGATIYEGHAAEHIAGADVLVISSAVPTDNPEVMAARAADIPVMKRADFLGHLMAEKKRHRRGWFTRQNDNNRHDRPNFAGGRSRPNCHCGRRAAATW